VTVGEGIEASMPQELLVTGGTVVTMDGERRIHPDGFVLVRDGEIAALGPPSELATETPAEHIDARGCVVVPGLINTHQHHWYNLFKGLGGGMLLEQWIQNLLAPTAGALQPPDLEASMRLACVEMVGSGTTTCLNHSVSNLDEAGVDATLRPVEESGMRQVLAKEIRPHPIEVQLELAETVHERWHGSADGRIAIAFVIEATAHWVAVGTCSDELVLRGHELATRLGARVSSHFAGGTMSREQG
jgi:5-methylthioadenosine/S-adenosylhomocysteine deaminase